MWRPKTLLCTHTHYTWRNGREILHVWYGWFSLDHEKRQFAQWCTWTCIMTCAMQNPIICEFSDSLWSKTNSNLVWKKTSRIHIKTIQIGQMKNTAQISKIKSTKLYNWNEKYVSHYEHSDISPIVSMIRACATLLLPCKALFILINWNWRTCT